MPMYNLFEYSDNYSMTSESFWSDYRDEINDDTNGNNAAHNKTSNSKTVTSKSFEYTAKLIGRAPNNNDILDAEVVVLLTYLSNFWRSLDLPLINCETGFDVSCSKECVKSEISIMPRIAGNPNARPPDADRPVRQTTGA